MHPQNNSADHAEQIATAVLGEPSDTGAYLFAPIEPPHLDAAIASDCRADIAAMREQSRADEEQAEAYLIEANALHERIAERQRHIDSYCTFLLVHGRAAK